MFKMTNETCNICPRNCNIIRNEKKGFCGCSDKAYIARAAAHFGEEPCIIGSRGSGAIFFSGCNLKCVYCQNYEISRGEFGEKVDSRELSGIMLRLQNSGVHNINIVTGTHYTPVILDALEKADLKIPVIWNSSGYEKAETLRMLDGIIDVYLPDYKYADPVLAKKYSFAEDYPEVVLAALSEMYRQTGKYIIDENGLIKKGVIIRHLILPGQYENTRDVIDNVSDSFPKGEVLFSLMSQYTPVKYFKAFPELNCTVSEEQNDNLKHYMLFRGLEGYCQETISSGTAMIPDFKENKII